MEKNILIIDKTGRGNAICDAFVRSTNKKKIFYLPGTGGHFHKRINVVNTLSFDDKNEIYKFCLDHSISMVVITHIYPLKEAWQII